MLPEVRITRKKDSNKSCLELNLVQESPRAHICLSPLEVELGGPKDWHVRSIIM